HRSLRASQTGSDLRFTSGANSTAAQPGIRFVLSLDTMVAGSRFELDQGLPLGHDTLLLHQPLAYAAALFGPHRYVQLHRLEHGNLRVRLDLVAGRNQSAQQLPGNGRSDVTLHRQDAPAVIPATAPRRQPRRKRTGTKAREGAPMSPGRVERHLS